MSKINTTLLDALAVAAYAIRPYPGNTLLQYTEDQELAMEAVDSGKSVKLTKMYRLPSGRLVASNVLELVPEYERPAPPLPDVRVSEAAQCLAEGMAAHAAAYAALCSGDFTPAYPNEDLGSELKPTRHQIRDSWLRCPAINTEHHGETWSLGSKSWLRKKWCAGSTDISELATCLGRTPHAVAWKLHEWGYYFPAYTGN